MAETTTKKVSLPEQIKKIQEELDTIDFNEDREAFMKKKKELDKVCKEYYNEKVTLKIPRLRGNAEKYAVIGWCDKLYRVERGVEVEVPRGVAEVWEASEAQKDKAYDYMHGLSEEANW